MHGTQPRTSVHPLSLLFEMPPPRARVLPARCARPGRGPHPARPQRTIPEGRGHARVCSSPRPRFRWPEHGLGSEGLCRHRSLKCLKRTSYSLLQPRGSDRTRRSLSHRVLDSSSTAGDAPLRILRSNSGSPLASFQIMATSRCIPRGNVASSGGPTRAYPRSSDPFARPTGASVPGSSRMRPFGVITSPTTQNRLALGSDRATRTCSPSPNFGMSVGQPPRSSG